MTKGNSPIVAQMEKVFRHTRANSYGTRARYKSSCNKFVQFLDETFKVKNLRNLHNKHLAAYVEHRQQVDQVAPKTLKNDLGSIRYMHDLLSNVKHELADNAQLQKMYALTLDQTPAVKGNRAWTQEEYVALKSFALERVRQGNGTTARTATDMPAVMTLCRTMGMRITEAVAMTRSQAEQAVRTGIYQIKNEAKNGKWRQVPVSAEAKKVIENQLEKTRRGGRFFVKENEKTHLAVNRFEKFLNRHREKVETSEGIVLRTWERDGKASINELTFHGLRYNYVQERVQEEIDKGFSMELAASHVTKEVGHERIDVINVYLGGTKDGLSRVL